MENKLDSPAGDSSVLRPVVSRAIQRDLLLNECWRQGAVEGLQGLTAVRIIRSIPKRIAYLWSTCDTSPQWLQVGIYHRFVQGYWFLVLPFAAIGMLRRWKDVRNDWPLLLFPAFITSIHLIFHVEARYSMPARPFMLLYSAAGLIWLFDSIRMAHHADVLRTPLNGPMSSDRTCRQ